MIINDFPIFYHAAQAWLNGLSPYVVPGFYNPVWAVLPFAPLTLLPINVAQWVWVLATLFGVLIAFARFKLTPKRAAAFVLLSPLVWLNVVFANVDWLVLLGATLPSAFGIWLVALKPQTGLIVIIGWTLRTWRQSGWRGVLKLLLPISIVLALQVVTIGLPRPDVQALNTWNVSLWPLGIPFGVLMLIKYVRSGSTDEALISALCLSPYLALPSWLMLVPWAARTSIRTVIAVIVVWACLLFWHINQNVYAVTIVGALSIIAAVWLGARMIKEARDKQIVINPVR